MSQTLLAQLTVNPIRIGDLRFAWRLGQITLEEAKLTVNEWRSQDECLIFEGKDQEGLSRVFAKPMSKRGNQAYRDRVAERFQGIESLFEADVEINVDQASGRGITNSLFVDFTVDPALFEGLSRDQAVEHAWLTFGREYNRFRAAIRRRFGNVDFVRVFQAHKSSFPHAHELLVFHDANLHTFGHKGILRIQEKDQIARMWSMGWSDVEVPGSAREVSSHVFRYIARFVVEEPTSSGSTEWDRFNDSLERNTSLMTLFRKRSFGLSREWSRRLKELQSSRLDSAPCIIQTPKLTDIKLVGFCSLREAIRSSKVPIELSRGRIEGFELETIPLDFREHVRSIPTSESQGALICKGSEITDPNKLDPYVDGPVYDELTVKSRRRINEITIRAGREGEGPTLQAWEWMRLQRP